MSIVDFNTDLLPFLEASADDSFGNIARVQAGVEEYFKSFTGREWETGTFKEETAYNHRDHRHSVFVNNPPITKITKVAVGTETALTITNTNTSTSAIVNVSNLGVTLTYNGTDTVGDFTFATNTTISSLATAINGAGSGWSATVTSGFESYLSTELVPRFGAEAIDSTDVEIKLPSQGLSNFEVNADTGEIYNLSGNSNGFRSISSGVLGSKIYVHYAGGYSTSTMPNDVKHAVMTMVSYIYKKLISGKFGIEQCSVAGISATFTKDGFPKDVMDTMNRHRKVRL
ncbi:hypothetical protein KAR91_88500 [Candidatus Pacearchaeota archaeon]|nr:hypothetical protein [Candidatus Pacearchaeota archaeon]